MLKFSRMINTIDAHTEGEPFRVITSGLPPLLGKTMLEKQRYMQENYDNLRKILMLEPRGHSGMSGCIITPPVTDDGDFGVVFINNEGYSMICGHGLIAVTKIMIENGMVPIPDHGLKVLKIDTPAGRVLTCGEMRDGRVIRVEYESVPSFVYARDVKVNIGGMGEITVDIVYGGAFYVSVEAKKLGLEVIPEHLDQLVKYGMELTSAITEQLQVVHPLDAEFCGISGTIIADPASYVGGCLESKNVCILREGHVDRSPSGTGTAARIALLYQQKLMDRGTTLFNKSMINTPFTGFIRDVTKVGDFDAVIPVVGGSAQITGYNQLVLEPEDSLQEGFRLPF